MRIKMPRKYLALFACVFTGVFIVDIAILSPELHSFETWLFAVFPAIWISIMITLVLYYTCERYSFNQCDDKIIHQYKTVYAKQKCIDYLSHKNVTDILNALLCDEMHNEIVFYVAARSGIAEAYYKISFEEVKDGTIVCVEYDAKRSDNTMPFIPPDVLDEYFVKKLDAEVLIKEDFNNIPSIRN